ncbi:hypothetical protein EST38_g14181 [Candolleomyces aberdarensis]|uniref:Uncharacterized protein n=1 Tax=Candolleomyces aberdarensis TaxID=2316362 RepID=A0A4Q2D0C2_9AGAR|nr:hypothetical protein EST38_g14181 [Candolleomyces aberdarensis]
MDHDTTVALLRDIVLRAKGGQFILLSNDNNPDWNVSDLRSRSKVDDVNEDLVRKLQDFLGTSQSAPGPAENLIDFDDDGDDEDEDEESHDEFRESEEAQGANEISSDLDDQGSEDLGCLILLLGPQSHSPPDPDLVDESESLISWDDVIIPSIPSVPKNYYVDALRGIQFLEPSKLDLDLGDAKLWLDKPSDEFDEDDGGKGEDTVKAGHLFTPLKRTEALVAISPRRLRERAPPSQSQETVNEEADEEALNEEIDDDEAGFLNQTVYDLDSDSPHKKRFRSAVTSQPSTLCTLPFLTKHNLVYNNKYNVIICTICSQGVLFDSLYAHVTGVNQAITKVWDDDLGAYQTVKERHSMNLGNRRQWEDRLLRDLRTALKEPDVTPISSKESMKMSIDQMQNLLKPHAGDDTPIEGIDIKEYGYVCNVSPCTTNPFPFIALTLIPGRHQVLIPSYRHPVHLSHQQPPTFYRYSVAKLKHFLDNLG